MDGRDKPGHDDVETSAPRSAKWDCLPASGEREQRPAAPPCILAGGDGLSDAPGLARLRPRTQETSLGVKSWISESRAAAPSSAHRARDWGAPARSRSPTRAFMSR